MTHETETQTSKSDQISILMREYERICTEIRGIEAINERLMTMGMTVIAAGLSYGLVSHQAEIFFILPILFIGVFFYASLNYYFIFSFGGYKRFLEERINTLSGEPLLIWEKVVSQRPRPTFISLSLAIVYVVILIGMISVSVDRILTAYPPEANPYVSYYFLLIIVLMLVLLLKSIRKMQVASREAYESAKSIYDKNEY